jgi:hypothetical protein
VPRPTDRFFTFSTFFQDYLRKNKNIRMHLNFTVGAGLPFGVVDNNIIYRNPYRFKPYHRWTSVLGSSFGNRNGAIQTPAFPAVQPQYLGQP